MILMPYETTTYVDDRRFIDIYRDLHTGMFSWDMYDDKLGTLECETEPVYQDRVEVLYAAYDYIAWRALLRERALSKH